MIDLLSKDLKHSEKYLGCSIDVWRDDRRGCYLAELYAPVRNRMLMQQRRPFSDIESAVAYMKEQIDKYYSQGWYKDCIIDVWFDPYLYCYWAELYVPVQSEMVSQEKQTFSDIQSALAYMRAQIDKYYLNQVQK
ncbi:hypothetical protein [Nostoc sp. UHCC 0252]|jgi:hypothetical protein|uniref:hypothetical protein n=1 Tax=Nostoc sp. UHCC 0252 TaxID=3110241 RepID=UPI002B1FFD8F|nr:hypothetical protein [Nostoc sp. UHCC 0252]MEA5605738.1 hypothetical protein [Nostoc sp. UHCC 0252]